MKRLSALLFLTSSLTLTAVAHEISADQSLRKAIGSATQIYEKADFALVHTQLSGQTGKALYYVFGSDRDGGFVITGADHRANTVLGYTDSGSFSQAMDIPAFRSWLSNCEAAMQWLSEQQDAAYQQDTAAEYALPMYDIPDSHYTNALNTISLTIPGRQYTEDPTLPVTVKPLLGGIVWDQGDPYIRLCPEIEINGQPDRCATGCVATATAQVMKYWQWPKQGTGSNRYTSYGDVPMELHADFSQSVYDWDSMLDDYSGYYTNYQAYAVAKLMLDVGIAEEMKYGVESAASSYSPALAMTKYFGYNKGMQLCDRLYYTYAEWNNMLKRELAASRPLIYRGTDRTDNVGHEFVIDGYDADGKYHINWGWGGRCNGYFDINYMDPDYQGIGDSYAGYNADHQVIINCYPDKDGTSEQQYLILAENEPYLMSDGTLGCSFINDGLATYTDGKFGYIAMIDNEIVGSSLKYVNQLAYGRYSTVVHRFEDLGVTPKMMGDKPLIIYPVYLDGEDLKVPQSMVSFQNYIMITLDADGNLESQISPVENARPICQSIEITRDYVGFSIKGKAVITAESGYPDFVRDISMYVYDEYNKIKARGTTCGYVNAGQSREIQFYCNPSYNTILEAGQTFNVSLNYSARGRNQLIPGSETTITLKDPGAKANLSYRNFTLDKGTIAPQELITVSFDVVNNGGFGAETYYVVIYKNGDQMSLISLPVEADLPSGTTTISKTLRADYEDGDYFVCVYTRDGNGNWNLISPEPLPFTIEGSESAISTITTDDTHSAPYYDPMGRAVVKPTRGLFIRDGKTQINI